MFVFVECGQTCHRYRCRFKSEIEYQEITRRNHYVHAEQRGKRQHVEFPRLERRILFFKRIVGLEQYDERCHAQYRFYQRSHLGRYEHSAEKFPVRDQAEAPQRMCPEKHISYGLEMLFPLL